MSTTISKKHNDIEILIGELSVKKSKKEILTVIKVYHQGIGSDEDLFIFYHNNLLNDWILDLDKSMICLTNKTNYRLIKEVYSKFRPSEPLNIQEFTDLLYDSHFDIFVESNQKAKTLREFKFSQFLRRMFFINNPEKKFARKH